MAKPQGIFKNAYFYYSQLNVPALQYEKEAVKDDPLANKEYVIDVLIPYKEFAKLAKDYPKDRALKSAKGKARTAEEFEKDFKVAPPEGKEWANSDGEYFVFKLKRYVKTADGKENTKARIVGCKPKAEVQRDRTGQEVGIDIAIGNGSFGKVQYEVRSYTKGSVGTALDVVGLQVLNLVPYVSNDVLFDDEDSEWDDEEDVAESPEEFEDDEEEESESDDSSEDDDDWDE